MGGEFSQLLTSDSSSSDVINGGINADLRTEALASMSKN